MQLKCSFIKSLVNESTMLAVRLRRLIAYLIINQHGFENFSDEYMLE